MKFQLIGGHPDSLSGCEALDGNVQPQTREERSTQGDAGDGDRCHGRCGNASVTILSEFCSGN